MNLSTPTEPFRVVALYRFFSIADPNRLRENLLRCCRGAGIKGTLILAREGINGTLAGNSGAIDALVELLRGIDGFEGAEVKYSTAGEMPFRRLKIRVKREIVTMGIAGIDPRVCGGTNVAPVQWNELISDPQTVVIDARNGYETAVGRFECAVDPGTASFREFPAWVERNRERLEGRRIAMYCTGGIRCEKAGAYLKLLGFAEVFQLRGGILNYLETVAEEDSLWRGECFVFDERVAVTHGLTEGDAELCRACRRPLTRADRGAAEYVAGVSCPHCRAERSEADRDRYAERQRQVEKAFVRGDPVPIGTTQPARRTA